MLLTFLERIKLLDLLPAETGMVEMRVLRPLDAALPETELEKKAWNIQRGGGRVQWDETKARSVEIEVSEAAHGIIVGVLQGMDKAGKLRREHGSLFEKFVEGKEDSSRKAAETQREEEGTDPDKDLDGNGDSSRRRAATQREEGEEPARMPSGT